MALQIRSTVFDPSVAARLTELSTILGNATVVGAVKKVPLPKSSSPKFVYEIACVGLMIHLEVGKDNTAIAALDAVITGIVGATGLVLASDNWEMGHDDDLRVG